MYPMRLDGLFFAVADPMRRRMVERLARGECSIGEVAAGLPISQPAASKHVKVLEQAGLIKRTVIGRVHHLELVPSAVETASTWLDRQRTFWAATLEHLSDVVTNKGEEKR